MKFQSILANRLKLIDESSAQEAPWKDPNNPSYDRQMAEDALFNTSGPMLDEPQWLEWDPNTHNEPPPGYKPGGPAPRWTKTEIMYAMAGDPNLLFQRGAKDHPRAPAYGRGAPIFRLARRLASRGDRKGDAQLISDLYGNGVVELTKMTEPGYDEGRGSFIKYVWPYIKGAMENGVGVTSQERRAAGGERASRTEEGGGQHGAIGLGALARANTPEEARIIGDQVKGQFRTNASNEKHSDNPFGKRSPEVYRLAYELAEALEEGDEAVVAWIKKKIAKAIQKWEGEDIVIPGIWTGAGEAMTTGRKASVPIASMDVEGDDETASMAGNIPDDETVASNLQNIDPEVVSHVLEIALTLPQETWALIGKKTLERVNKQTSSILTRDARRQKLGDKELEKMLKGAEIGASTGPLTVNEFRYIIRRLGPVASNYPGKGNVRKNVGVPRDGRLLKAPSKPQVFNVADQSKAIKAWQKYEDKLDQVSEANWWSPGEDPEIEPIPDGGLWKSIWVRKGYNRMGPTAIAQEMTQELDEFIELNIPSDRAKKWYNDKKKGKKMAISKVAVSRTYNLAFAKIATIVMLQYEDLDIEESTKKYLRDRGMILFEDMDQTDKYIIRETFAWLLGEIRSAIIECYKSAMPVVLERR